MVIHSPYDRKSSHWFDLPITQVDNTHLSIPAGFCWVANVEYGLPAYAPEIGLGLFRLWVEKTSTGADYFLDLTMEGKPSPFNENCDGILVAWRDSGDSQVHVYQSQGSGD